jgi:hypothetical protein
MDAEMRAHFKALFDAHDKAIGALHVANDQLGVALGGIHQAITGMATALRAHDDAIRLAVGNVLQGVPR